MSKLGKQFKIVMVHNNKHVVHGLSLTLICTLEIAGGTCIYVDQGLHPKIMLFFVSKSFPLSQGLPCPKIILFLVSKSSNLAQGLLCPKIILFFVSKSFLSSCSLVGLFPCYTDILVCVFVAVRYRFHPQCML